MGENGQSENFVPEHGVIPPAFQRAPLLTQDEINAIRMTAVLHELIGEKVIGNGPARWGDYSELTSLIHGLQRMVMSQAAARSYPRELRLLGEGVLPDEDKENNVVGEATAVDGAEAPEEDPEAQQQESITKPAGSE